MKTSSELPLNVESHDEDLIDQARARHGVPSQDPSPEAQFPLSAREAEREGKSVLTAGGLIGGAALGAAIGATTGGPVGVVIGGAAGAIVGTLSGAAAGPLIKTPGAGPVL